MNFILDLENQTEANEWAGYASPNKAALDMGLISEEYRSDPTIYPDSDNLEAWIVWDSGLRTLWNEAWAAIEAPALSTNCPCCFSLRSSTGRKGHQLMQRVLGKSLKARLNRLLILVGILPIAIVFGFFLLSMRPNVISGAEERLLESSQLQALAVRNELDEARTNIELLAANPFVGSGDIDPELELEQLHQASDFFKVFEDITVLTPQGQVRSSTTFSYLGSWKSSSAFTNALAGDTYVSRVLVAPDTMDLVINISAPVVKDGRVTAIVVGRMEMQEIWKLLEPLAIGDSGHALALDQNGNLIAHPDSERLLTKLSSDALIDDISALHAAPAHDLDDAHDLGRAHSILLEFSDGSVETLGAFTNIEDSAGKSVSYRRNLRRLPLWPVLKEVCSWRLASYS